MILIDLTGIGHLSRKTKLCCIRWNMAYGGKLSGGNGNRARRRMWVLPHDPPIGHLMGMNRSEFAEHFGFKHPDAK